MATQKKIVSKYLEYVLEKDERPSSVYKLAKELKIKEEEVYEHFNSITAIEQFVWESFFVETKEKIESEEVYREYSVREKMLAFYFTWLETLKSNRSYVLFVFRNRKPLDLDFYFLDNFKKHFKGFVSDLMLEGQETQEVATRPYISSLYPRFFALQVLSILKFWVRDNSKGFEQTDAYIEKTVNFSFDAIGPSAIDSAFDLFKFKFQS